MARENVMKSKVTVPQYNEYQLKHIPNLTQKTKGEYCFIHCGQVFCYSTPQGFRIGYGIHFRKYKRHRK